MYPDPPRTPIHRVLPWLAVPSLLSALAGEAQADTTKPANGTRIFEGEPVQECGWPTTVAITGTGTQCSGTLIHPRVVVYAAHCGVGRKTIRFSQSWSGGSGGASVQGECTANPDYDNVDQDQPDDQAFCVLDSEVTLPVTPVAMGCETAFLQAETEAVLVGFGNNSSAETGGGTKRWRLTTIFDIFDKVIQFPAPSVCSGDSGGPAFVRLPDGGWRVFGIASTVADGCGGFGTHARIDTVVPWIEETSGIDVTPCHDAEGNWDPTPECGAFYAGETGATGSGTWQDGCAGTPTSPASETCGPAFDAEPDDEAPLVSIVNPAHLDTFESGQFPGVVEVDASDPRYGVRVVRMEINGTPQGLTDNEAPYVFNANFPDGVWEIVAVAEDFFGNVGRSEPVLIGIGETPVDPTGGDGDSETGNGGDSDGDGNGDGDGDDPKASPGDGDGDSGCSVSGTKPTHPRAHLGVLLLFLIGGRRQRVKQSRGSPIPPSRC